MENRSTVIRANVLCLVLLCCTILIALAARSIFSRDLPFDETKWKDVAKTSEIDTRYRMVKDLARKLEVEKPELARTLEMLGPPESGKGSPMLRYSLGHRNSLIVSGTYYLSLGFNEEHRLEIVEVNPD